MSDENEFADILIKKMAQEIGTYQSPLVRRMAVRCALVAVNKIIESDTQFHYGSFYSRVKTILLNS